MRAVCGAVDHNAGGVPLGQDAYDFVGWVAAQPWCDGNVGMIGISSFGSMQVLAAAERPPSLRAILAWEAEDPLGRAQLQPEVFGLFDQAQGRSRRSSDSSGE